MLAVGQGAAAGTNFSLSQIDKYQLKPPRIYSRTNWPLVHVHHDDVVDRTMPICMQHNDVQGQGVADAVPPLQMLLCLPLVEATLSQKACEHFCMLPLSFPLPRMGKQTG